MPIHIDPQTRQRVVYDKRSVDLQYDMIGDKAIAEETVPVIGNWEDYTGSEIINSRLQQMQAGLSNQLFGTDPAILGAKVGALGIVGQNTQTTRRRTKRKYVDVSNEGIKDN